MEAIIAILCISNYCITAKYYAPYIFKITQKSRTTKLNTSLMYTVHAYSCDKLTGIFYIIRYQLYKQ